MTAVEKDVIADGLRFPFGRTRGQVPAAGETLEVAPGVHWLRMPLPFALDHINLWLLEDGEGWTLVDTGIDRAETKTHWRTLFAGPMGGRPAKRLIVTHFHPDHMGLAGWLTGQCKIELWTTQTEWLMARMSYLDTEAEGHLANVEFLGSHGLSKRWTDEMAGWGNSYRKRVSLPPAHFNRIQHGDEIEVGGRVWRVIVGTGHAPEHACLFCPELKVLISGDQILPKITPNIAVWGLEPDANPLEQYLGSLERFRDLPEDTLVLPSHNYPFVGVRTRLDQLRDHHVDRLDRLVGAFEPASSGDDDKPESLTAADLIPVLFRREMDAHQITFAMGESIAHLAYLVGDGRLVRTIGPDEIYHYRLRDA